MKNRSAAALAAALALCGLFLAPALAHAGPPLLCWPMSIGGAPSLPWGSGWHDTRPDYDRARLADDTLALLGPQPPTLVRMETLRRAALYASTDDRAAERLFRALRSRVGGEGDARAQALARFDLGYGAEAYRQTRWGRQEGGSTANGIEMPEDSYALVHQALDALRPDPALEYAAALVTISRPAVAGRSNRDLAQKHLKIATQEATKGSDLAQTLAAHARLWSDAAPKGGPVASR